MKAMNFTRTDTIDIAIPIGSIIAYVIIQNALPDGGRIFGNATLPLLVAILPALLVTVMTAVRKAAEVAEVIGEPFGTLLLTVAITIIEVALILAIMFNEKGDPGLVRDTIYAVIIIVCNGLVGLCILVGGLKHGEQDFEIKGANAHLAVISALAVLVLILPNYTSSTPTPTLTQSQLIFVSVVTALLYAVFVYIQTVRHTEFFTEVHQGSTPSEFSLPDEKLPLLKAVIILFLALCAVVLLAKTFADSLQVGLSHIGSPPAAAGFIVAFLIVLPEGIAAFRAARANELQRAINLSLGYPLATFGLTVPVVAVLAAAFDLKIVLGLPSVPTVLILLTLLVSAFTFGTGRTNILYGFIHLIIFATAIFLIFFP